MLQYTWRQERGRLAGVGLTAVVVVALIGPPAVPAQVADLFKRTEPTAAAEVTLEDIARKQALLASESAAATHPAERALLDRLGILYAQQEALVRALAEAAAARDAAIEGLREQRTAGLQEPPPYSLVVLDELRDELESIGRGSKTFDDRVGAADASLGQAKRVLESRQGERRRARDAVETNRDPERLDSLRVELRLEQLESSVAEEVVVLRTLEVRRERIERETQAAKVEFLTERIKLMEGTVHFTDEELAERLERVDQREAELTEQLHALQGEIEAAQRQWDEDKEKLDLAGSADPELAERVEASRRAHIALQLESGVISERLGRLASARDLWNRRFAIASGTADSGALTRWRSDARGAIAQLEREDRIVRGRLTEARKDVLSLTERLAEMSPVDVNEPWVRAQRDALQRLVAAHERNLNAIEIVGRLQQRLADELQVRRASRSLAERGAAAWVWLVGVWRYEITSIDDQSITIGKVFVALFLLTVGLRIARLASHLFGQRLLPRLGVPVSASSAFESVAYYVAVIGVILFALRTVNIPLTAFAVIGGALAIGIGFGSQNIVNNFISGLILLAERPMSAGDMVEIEGTLGVIDRIGARSTRVKTFDNTHVLIPNSFFLDNRFVNWTLSDDIVRGQVRVGVAYGAPVDEVMRLLAEATHGERLIQRGKKPPWVRFQDFGDNALIFDLYFFVKPLGELWDVQTRLRVRIEKLLREAGITIAFPQRDVHLDTARPLEVRFLPSDEASETRTP